MERMNDADISENFIVQVMGPPPQSLLDVKEESAECIGCAVESPGTQKLMTLLERHADSELHDSDMDRWRSMQQYLHQLTAAASLEADRMALNLSDADASWLLLLMCQK